MAHIPLSTRDGTLDPEVERVFAEIERDLGFGMVPNLFLAMASQPRFLESSWMHFRSVILTGVLPRTLKEMAGVVISQHNGSHYARDVHLHGLSAFGTDEDTLRALGEDFESSSLPDRQKSLIRLALRTAVDPRTIDEDELAALRDQGISDAEAFEMIATGCLFSWINRFTDAVALEVDAL